MSERIAGQDPAVSRKIPAHSTNGPACVSQTPPPSTDSNWETALDWWLRLQEQPADPTLRRELQGWLQADPAHRAAFDRAGRVWQLSGALDFSAATPRRHRTRLYGLACAASLLLAAVLLAPLFLAPDWQAGHGEHLQVRLEDGSQVLLASGSAIDVRFDATTRRIVLRQGRVFFEVRPDPARPFVVDAAPLRVQVTGTRFDVARYDTQVTVEVANGSVQVAGEQVLGSADLMTGQRLSLRRDARQWQQEALPLEHVAVWRDWQLLVRDRPLGDVVEQLRPYLPGVVLLPDAELAERRLSAWLDLRQPQQALQTAVSAAGGRLQAWSPYLLVLVGQ